VRNQRGSIAVELGLALPVFILVVCGGLSLGRALVTKHNLEAAVAVVTRQAAIANQRSQSVIHNNINARLGNERIACDSLQTQVRVIPGGVAGSPDALEVTTTCQLAPMFKGLLSFGVDHVTAVVAMPLPI
jgi:Flp pilus assembly protein TadG